MSSGGEVRIQFDGGDQLGELGRFLQELEGSIELRERWRTGPGRIGVIESSELTVETQLFVKSNPDPVKVRTRLQAETGPGNQTWICVWIR